MVRANNVVDHRESVTAAFGAMPWLLKLITVNACLGLVFIPVLIAVPSIDVIDRQIPASEFWSSGAGLVCAFALLPPLASAWLMLRRSPRARIIYLSSLTLLALSTLVVARLTDTDMNAAMLNSGGQLLLASLLGCYLYLSRGVRGYFAGQRT